MIALAALPSLVKTSFKPLKTEKAQQETDRPTVAAPILQDLGPTGDGATKLKLTNSIPHSMVFTMKQENQEKKGLILKPCPDCKIYTGSIPKDACERGTTETFSVDPGEHRIRGSWENATISDIAATWQLAPGRKYGLCIVMDLTKGRNNWDHK